MTFITLAYALGLAALLLLADLGGLRNVGEFINHTFLLDKAVHFVMYGVLAFLAGGTLLHRFKLRPVAAIATGSIFVLLLSTLEEASNAFTAYRTCSLADLAANYLGILVLGVLPLVAWQRHQTNALGERATGSVSAN